MNRLGPIALAATLFLTSFAGAQLPVVTLYENAGFGGAAFPLVVSPVWKNKPLDLAAFNDRTTSVRWRDLPASTAIILYENRDGSGAQYRISGSTSGSVSNVGATYNDTFSAIAWELDSSSSGVVQLSEDARLRGIQKRLPFSSYSEGHVHRLYGFNDKASSMWISLKPDEIVTFYEHPDGTGREFTITHRDPRVDQLMTLPSGYDDMFSSFRWDRIVPGDGWIRMFTDRSYGGFQLTRYVSETGFRALGLPGYDNQIESLQWNLPRGTTVFLRDGGACRALTDVGQEAALLGMWQDSISGIEIHDGDLCADGSDRTKPYDRNTYLCANNAHASRAHDWSNQWYQDLTVSRQLDYGVRALRIKTLLRGRSIYLVNGSWSSTLAQRSGRTPELLSVLAQRVRVWLDVNPREVLTMIIEHSGGSELGSQLLNISPLRDLIHVQRHGSWPTLNDLIASGKRVVVFEHGSTPKSPRLATWLGHTVANSQLAFGATNPLPGSLPIDELGRSVFYMNHVSPLPPNLWNGGATHNHVANLRASMGRFAQVPNFIGVDRITEGGGGGADAARTANFKNWPLRDQAGVRGEFAQFGRDNCGGRVLEAGNRPVVGTTFNVRITTAQPTAIGAGALMVAASDRLFAGASVLPLDLQPLIGLPCDLLVSPEIMVPFSGSSTVPYVLPLTIPNSASLFGAEVFLQGAELGASNFAMTTGGRARVGAR